MSPVDLFLTWWLRSGRHRWSWLRRKILEGKYLAVDLPAANSLKEIEDCLSQVTWTMDGPLHLFDCISYPQRTWATKKDDCDGFASLAAKLLSQWNTGCRPVLITAMVRPVKGSHTVCAFSSGADSIWFFDNSLLRKEICQCYRDVVSEITFRGSRLVCWDVRDPDTLEAIEFHKVPND